MIKKKPFGNTLKEQLIASGKDKLYTFIMADKTVRGGIVHGTKMINEMRANHELGILETLVLGHAYLAASLMALSLKKNDQLSLQIECSGPIKGLTVESNAYGEVRGYLKQNPIPIDKPLESFNLSPFFGAGFLSVTKYLEDSKHPFTGKVMMESGSIAKDLTLYFLKSEQIPTAFDLSIQFDKKGEVIGAGGFFLQALPNAKEETVSQIESQISNMPSLGEYFSNNHSPEKLVTETFKAYTPQILSNMRIEFMCRCNQNKIRNMLNILPMDELEDILNKGPFPVEICCHHCNTTYAFNKDEIQDIYSKRK